MPLLYWEVDVPIHHDENPGVHGVHVFTGRALSRADAVDAARTACDQTLLALIAGQQPPAGSSGDWTATGLRPGWVLHWESATAGVWGDSPAL